MDTGGISSAAMNPRLDNETTLTGWYLWFARLVWLVLTILVLLTVSQIWPGNYGATYYEWSVNQSRPAVQTVLSYENFVSFITILESLSALTALIMGFVIFRYKSNDKIGLLVSAFLILASPWILSSNMETWRLPYWMPFGDPLVTLLMAATLSSLVLFFYLFPDGRFVPGWTRWPAALTLLALASFVVGGFFNIPPPIEYLWIFYVISVFSSLIIAGAAQLYRYRTLRDSQQRQQIKWVVWGIGLFIVVRVPGSLGILGGSSLWGPVINLLGWILVQFFLTLTIGFSILRYRLWDIDLLINRTIVYGLLTALVVGLYIVLVGALGGLFRLESNPLIAILATGLVAVSFEPLRRRLQRGVNRLMYGEQDDPVALLSKLGTRLEEIAAPENTLVSFAETLAHSLKLPHVAIWSEASRAYGTPLARYGVLSAESVTLPLNYQGESVGRLVVGLRSKGVTFSTRERQLLETVARQVGMVVHALRLTADLQQSRERLVTTREDERRRLRRDLHDGLGPQLASFTLKVNTVRIYLRQELDKGQSESLEVADHLLVELKGGIQETIQDIRRLAHDLRPPALDQLGLVPALQTHAAQNSTNGLLITVDAPETLPLLPAAVEVAAYRVALEAITNVGRHAHAAHCTVRLTINGDLCLKISDDGVGLPQNIPIGVGLASMRERTAELGGRLDLQSRPGKGTQVSVTLPITRLSQ